jgi:hypothetical protein
MPMVIEQVKRFTLARSNVMYTFTPQEGGTEVERTAGRSRSCYSMSAEEARQLWKRLTKQGYERF